MAWAWRERVWPSQLNFLQSMTVNKVDAFIMSGEPNAYHGDKVHNDSLTSLYGQLDALWIQYLTLLDEYTKAQAAIQKHMSSGFFTLAQANFKSSRGRYGQDYYDERAVATTRIKIDAETDAISLKVEKFIVRTDEEQPSEDQSQEASSEHEIHGPNGQSQSEPVQLPSPEPTPEPESKLDPLVHSEAKDLPDAITPDTSTDPAPAESANQEKSKSLVNSHDPIRWFGILVPATLRQAQNSFVTAVRDGSTVTTAVNSSRGMREVEVEIRKLRKAIKKEEKKSIDALPIIESTSYTDRS